jgi:hypothetical protein
MENPYLWTTEKLLDKFMNACARAGVSNSGFVISFSSGSDLGNAHYLRSVLSARLNRVEPPAHPGAKVQPRSESVAPSHSNGWKRSNHPRPLPEVLTIDRVYYKGGNSWEFQFVERSYATADRDGVYAEDGGESWWIPLNFKAGDFQPMNEVPAKV